MGSSTNVKSEGNTSEETPKRMGKLEETNVKSKEAGLKIFLFVEHACGEINHSIYMIHQPLDLSAECPLDSQGFMAAETRFLSYPCGMDSFIAESAMFKLGSRIYFFGGINHLEVPDKRDVEGTYYTPIPLEFKLTVRFLDTNHPEKGLIHIASMNAPKQRPCVFSAPDGMMYALGAALEEADPGSKGRTGCFERYDPKADKWEILPDPPLSLYSVTWCDCATVVDHYVFIGNASYLFIFNLDTQEWDPLLPPPTVAARFPYGSLYVDQSLYYLRGMDTWKPGTDYGRATEKYRRSVDVELVKRGPLPILNGEGPSTLLNSEFLEPDNAVVMATVSELDNGTFFTDESFSPWREIFHLGGPFFCYVVTAQLVDWDNRTRFYEPYCRGVLIKVFKKVHAENDIKKPEFQLLASFCYKIHTNFHNSANFIRCCAFGNVPDSWVKAPQGPKKKQVKRKDDFKAVEHGCYHDIETGNNRGHEGGGDFKKAIAGEEEETSRLRAELAKKDELLKTYDAAKEEESSRLRAELAEKDELLAEKDELLKAYEALLAESGDKLVPSKS